MNSVVLLLCVGALLVSGQEPQGCRSPKPTPDFKYDMFEGRWYEIGFWRNTGALIWNANCVCSTVNVTKDAAAANPGDSLMTYVCNEETPDEEPDVFDTDLVMMNPPGKWKQIVAPLPLFDAQEFVVLEITDDYALSYRCGDYVLADSYTILIMARKPSLDRAIIEKLTKKVEQLELNTEGALYLEMDHTNCTYTGH